eukprot:Protomagalhaensia_sp_Gyna_25__1196@NODE_1593_length_1705_cov_43_105042_g1299_i0_p1_GENE_NODE_1593_length_1705_cov_43_105042_g1299_i0NODE_1593_length_1705_cov_43_105042_g1299_i0_p1_ORF_typecomplete_len548_score90_34DEAD/PF00270_29/3_1e48DEAD/PF00270_29/4_9e02DEAD/PF00270_29/3_8e03Helicase_C/PF00271_31/0_4Helicase_C/PF00271_31/1_3e04Helicase_C/PF00271_31/3_2e26ResIII/PF04851_15/1_9e11ResIII/PF04851_15/8_7e02UTP25/PF06862_12/0_38UTP25/PF06862_12/0_0032ERCC3_RAD25_C/PF16203_5/2_2e06Flavi_DEAD/PF0765
MDFGGLSDFEESGPTAQSQAELALRRKAEAVKLALGEHLRTNVEWADLGLSKPLLKAVQEIGYANPTPIQRDTIPHALAGRDVLGRAETGSGKTCAFLLPCLDRLMQSNHVKRRRFNKHTGEMIMSAGSAVTKVLVLLPTRELALQCFKACESLKKYAPITVAPLTGGMSSKQQEFSMRHSPDIVVATPGRCLDLLLNSTTTHLDLLDIVVFDEADRLVDMGFKDECLRVLGHCSSKRQTLLFSATLSTKATELSQLALKNPVYVPKELAESSVAATVAKALEQSFISISKAEERLPVVLALLDQETKVKENDKVIVFFNTKKIVHRLSLILQTSELRLPSACELHGDLSQQERLKALDRFENGGATLMLCTDIAGRGLDLTNVALVVNAEVPNDPSKYVHRVGRSGRRGMAGRAVTVFLQSERAKVKEMVKRVTDKVVKFSSDTLPASTVSEYSKIIEGCKPRVKELLRLEEMDKMLDAIEDKAHNDLKRMSKEVEGLDAPVKKNWSKRKSNLPTPKKSKKPRLVADPTSVMYENVNRVIHKQKKT